MGRTEAGRDCNQVQGQDQGHDHDPPGRAPRRLAPVRQLLRQAVLAQAGGPIRKRPRDPAKTYFEDAIVRLPGLVLPTTPDGEAIELEPVLLLEVYERILRDIRVHTQAMEQNPATYAGMGEEHRRNVIVNALAPG